MKRPAAAPGRVLLVLLVAGLPVEGVRSKRDVAISNEATRSAQAVADSDEVLADMRGLVARTQMKEEAAEAAERQARQLAAASAREAERFGGGAALVIVGGAAVILSLFYYTRRQAHRVTREKVEADRLRMTLEAEMQVKILAVQQEKHEAMVRSLRMQAERAELEANEVANKLEFATMIAKEERRLRNRSSRSCCASLLMVLLRVAVRVCQVLLLLVALVVLAAALGRGLVACGALPASTLEPAARVLGHAAKVLPNSQDEAVAMTRVAGARLTAMAGELEREARAGMPHVRHFLSELVG